MSIRKYRSGSENSNSEVVSTDECSLCGQELKEQQSLAIHLQYNCPAVNND